MKLNWYQTSKEYYTQVLKKEKINLNSSKEELNFLDYHLEKLLDVTYKFFHPFFADEESTTPYKNEYASNTIDKEFDEEVNRQTPYWIQAIIGFLIKIYYLIFPIKIIRSTLHQIQNFTFIQKVGRLICFKSRNNFFTLNSSP